MERSQCVVRLRFHRLVLRGGTQCSHLISEETEAHREDGFRSYYSGYLAGPESRTRSEKATWKLNKTEGPSRMLSHVFGWS